MTLGRFGALRGSARAMSGRKRTAEMECPVRGESDVIRGTIDSYRTNSASTGRRWVDRGFLPGVGAGSGLLGGLCCVGGAVAVGLGWSGLSFLGAWMGRDQIYFVAGSAVLMLLWLARVARPYGFTGQGLRHAGRALGRHALIMGIVYAATLGLTMAAYALFQRLR